MKKNIRILLTISILVLGTLITGCSKHTESTPEPSTSPYITIPCGDDYVQIIPQKGAEVSDFKATNFVMDGQRRIYLGKDYTTTLGIDVSSHQGDIDWNKVRESGVEFVYIRAGYRGYTLGGLNRDKYFHQNITGAKAAGLKVGVYFFSQAITREEAGEEADYCIKLIDEYSLDLPVMYDWERMYDDESRTEKVSLEGLTEWCMTFCDKIKSAGYDAGVYTNRKLAYGGMDITVLQKAGLTFWVRQYDWWPDFYYKHEIWQYSYKGQIEGIEGTVDLNLQFSPVQ